MKFAKKFKTIFRCPLHKFLVFLLAKKKAYSKSMSLRFSIDFPLFQYALQFYYVESHKLGN